MEIARENEPAQQELMHVCKMRELMNFSGVGMNVNGIGFMCLGSGNEPIWEKCDTGRGKG